MEPLTRRVLPARRRLVARARAHRCDQSEPPGSTSATPRTPRRAHQDGNSRSSRRFYPHHGTDPRLDADPHPIRRVLARGSLVLGLADASNGSQCFPRYRYRPVNTGTLFGGGDDAYEQHDAILPRTLDAYRARHGAKVSADDVFHYVYGILHSPEYQERFAAELGKMLPRIPMVEDFFAFAEAGRRLADLHVHYDTVDPWPLDGLPDPGVSPRELRVERTRFGGPARTPDRSVIVVNPHIALAGIPEEAHRYQLNGRSALEWLIDRYQVKVNKSSGISNDPNNWDGGGPRYIVELVARIVRVSVETVELVEGLPSLGV